MSRSGATNRSEALRDLARRGLSHTHPDARAAECIGVVTFAVDPTVRDLARRVPLGRQDNHDVAVAALSVPIDHAASVEVEVMRGTVGSITEHAERLFHERGVKHGAVHLIPVRTEMQVHTHGTGHAHAHRHLKVLDGF